MTAIERNKLANKITKLLDMNGGVADSYIKELMAQYRAACKN